MFWTPIISSVDIISMLFRSFFIERMSSVIWTFAFFFFFFLLFFFFEDIVPPISSSFNLPSSLKFSSSFAIQKCEGPFFLCVTSVQPSMSFSSFVPPLFCFSLITSPVSFDIGSRRSSSPCIHRCCCIKSASLSIAIVSSSAFRFSSTFSSLGLPSTSVFSVPWMKSAPSIDAVCSKLLWFNCETSCEGLNSNCSPRKVLLCSSDKSLGNPLSYKFLDNFFCSEVFTFCWRSGLATSLVTLPSAKGSKGSDLPIFCLRSDLAASFDTLTAAKGSPRNISLSSCCSGNIVAS